MISRSDTRVCTLDGSIAIQASYVNGGAFHPHPSLSLRGATRERDRVREKEMKCNTCSTAVRHCADPVKWKKANYINSRTNDRATSGETPRGRRASGPPSSRIGS